MKTKTIFVCQECGAQSPRWEGRCSSCGAWNSVIEEQAIIPAGAGAGAGFGGGGSGGSARTLSVPLADDPVLLTAVPFEKERRLTTDIRELDRVLGGGIVPGSVILIGGDPGIGKSTLSLQIGCRLGEKGANVLYVSGEESVQQTSLRAGRITSKGNQGLYIVSQVDCQAIVAHIKALKPKVVVMDSIQVIYHPAIASSPGSVTQVRECAGILTQLAKTSGMSLFIIGHVTKEGMLAGPRVLEHMVDTVLYFEGERYSAYRILRATKNRFGSTNEIGVFEMTSSGLMEVTNPSEIFLSERPKNAAGSVVVPVMEGTRPFLVEIQGLVSHASFGMVRHKAQGFDNNRLAILIAVLEKRLGLNLQDKDVFLNVVGGVKVMDPAADLGVVMAVASALLDKPVAFDTVVCGEVGLSSEVRSVSQVAVRLMEAEKLGFKTCIVPKNNVNNRAGLNVKTIAVEAVETVREALDVIRN